MILKIRDLLVKVGGKEVLKGVDLEVKAGELVVIEGANGGGKSSLANALIGRSDYEVVGGEIMFGGENLLEMEMDERARAGIMMGYQSPVAIPGVKVFNLIKSTYEALRQAQGKPGIENVVELKKKIEEVLERVGLPREYVGREVNNGFSGGEKKRLELAQILLFEPKLVIFDEIDSGIDKKGRVMVREIIEELKSRGTAVLVISHNEQLLEGMEIERRLVMKKGKLEEMGN